MFADRDQIETFDRALGKELLFNWAHEKRPEEIVGNAVDRYTCPLACYLNETYSEAGGTWAVGYGYARCVCGKEEETYYPLGEQQRAILWRVDACERSITAAEFIAILEEL